MTPRERLLTTMRGGAADRVPLVLEGLLFRSPEAIAKHRCPYTRKLAERVFEKMHFAVNVPSHHNRFFCTPPRRIRRTRTELPNGRTRAEGVIDTPKGELTFVEERAPEQETTWTVKYPCESREDIEKIASVPWELPEKLAPPSLQAASPSLLRRSSSGCEGRAAAADRLPGPLAARFLKNGPLEAGFLKSGRGVVRTGVSSPFVCAAGMMTYQSFLELCATDLDLVKGLTAECLRREMDILKVLFSKPGIEYVWIGGSEWLTPPMGSPALYDSLVQEQEREMIEFVHSRSDAVVHIHCHNKVRRALVKTIERGADFTEPVEPPPDGDITMAEAKEVARGRITLGGNIEERVLANEPEAAVEAAVRAAFEGGKSRFILANTAGPSPMMSEREFRNYSRVIDLWEEMSEIA